MQRINPSQALSTASLQQTTHSPVSQRQPNEAPPSHKTITDFWGVFVALYGVRFTSQFGETPDTSGEWAKTLKGVSRAQIAAGLERVRMSGREWPPTAPEFRALCLADSGGVLPTVELAYAELSRFVADGRSDAHNLSSGLYHTLRNHMNLFSWRQLPTDKGLDLFRFAYRATLEQARNGVTLETPPNPNRLLEDNPTPKTPEQIEADRITAEAARLKLKAMFAKPEQFDTPPTEAELKDLERVERIKRGEL